MLLKEAHDIGEELQKKIERIPEVERVRSHRSFSPLGKNKRTFFLGICSFGLRILSQSQ